MVLDESERLPVLVNCADGDNEKERLKDWERVVDWLLLLLCVLLGDRLTEFVALRERVRVGLRVGDLLPLPESDPDQEPDELQESVEGVGEPDPEAVLLRVRVWLSENVMVALCEGVEVGLFEWLSVGDRELVGLPEQLPVLREQEPVGLPVKV